MSFNPRRDGYRPGIFNTMMVVYMLARREHSVGEDHELMRLFRNRAARIDVTARMVNADSTDESNLETLIELSELLPAHY